MPNPSPGATLGFASAPASSPPQEPAAAHAARGRDADPASAGLVLLPLPQPCPAPTGAECWGARRSPEPAGPRLPDSSRVPWAGSRGAAPLPQEGRSQPRGTEQRGAAAGPWFGHINPPPASPEVPPSCRCRRKGHVGMGQGTSTSGLAGEQREPRATTHRLSTSPAAVSQPLGDSCALVAPMWGLQASPQTHRRVQRSPRSPRMPWCFGPRSAHRGLGEGGPLHQLWCGDNSPGPHSVKLGWGRWGRRGEQLTQVTAGADVP